MKQDGNVLFIIFVAIALFASLTYAVTKSGNNSGNIDRETALLEASTIISYADTVARAVTRMDLAGVDEDDFCFDHADWGHTNYDHAGCTDNANRVFHKSGGGAGFKKTPPHLSQDFFYTGTISIVGIGTSAPAW